MTAIKKLHLKETVLFAIKTIPEVHAPTLEKFLELVNATGTFGDVSLEELLNKISLTLKYVPDASPQAMAILCDLLEADHPRLIDMVRQLRLPS